MINTMGVEYGVINFRKKGFIRLASRVCVDFQTPGRLGQLLVLYYIEPSNIVAQEEDGGGT